MRLSYANAKRNATQGGQQSFACRPGTSAQTGLRDLFDGGMGDKAIAIATPHLVNDSLERVLELDAL